MNQIQQTFLGIMIPFIGTTLGAAAVYFLKKELSARISRALLGLASGVMIAASVWSLLIPAVEMAEANGIIPWVPALAGFSVGIISLLLLGYFFPEQKAGDKGSPMLFLAVTLHNIPEGMAVGVVFAGMLSGNTDITFPAALALSVGIAIQNLPEGAIISMPLAGAGVRRGRAFGYGFLSGTVEPIGGIIMILLTSYLAPLLPYILSFAAGAMLYVVVAELIPESITEDDTSTGVIGCALGFALMMVLDVALG